MTLHPLSPRSGSNPTRRRERRPIRRAIRLGVERLEERQLLSGGPGTGDAPASTPANTPSPIVSLIPIRNSLPGAAVTLYLDFDGHDDLWYDDALNDYIPTHTPRFSLDDDRNHFSAAELAAIDEIWQRVAEDYAPFHVNVTTVEPPELAPGASPYVTNAVRVAVGGDWTDWLGSEASGVAFSGSSLNGMPNTAYAFDRKIQCQEPTDCVVFTPRYIAEVASHEAAHVIGLHHQSEWGSSDVIDQILLHEYHPGNGTVVPIMGNSAKEPTTPRSIWWSGQNEMGKPQNDFTYLANRLGQRPDDHGNNRFTATAINPISATAGVIGYGGEGQPDTDYFVVDTKSTPTGMGKLSISAAVAPVGPNLDVKLQVYKAGSHGSLLLVAESDPAHSLDASLTVPLGEKYWIVVQGHKNAGNIGPGANYIDMGQFTLNVSIQPKDRLGKRYPKPQIIETICDPLGNNDARSLDPSSVHPPDPIARERGSRSTSRRQVLAAQGKNVAVIKVALPQSPGSIPKACSKSPGATL